jgi:hypothetical protein
MLVALTAVCRAAVVDAVPDVEASLVRVVVAIFVDDEADSALPVDVIAASAAEEAVCEAVAAVASVVVISSRLARGGEGMRTLATATFPYSPKHSSGRSRDALGSNMTTSPRRGRRGIDTKGADRASRWQNWPRQRRETRQVYCQVHSR